jgi:hypothetical protein
MGKQRSRSRSRSRRQRQSKQQGGFIRGGTPQFAEMCGPNPLNQYSPFNVLNNNTPCTECQTQTGGRRSRKNSRKQKHY